MGQLPPEQIQQILAGNAAKLYNFDLDALRPAADKFGPTVAEVAQPLDEAARGRQPGAAALGSAAEGRQLVSCSRGREPIVVPGPSHACGRTCGQPVENPLITGENVPVPVGNGAHRNN